MELNLSYEEINEINKFSLEDYLEQSKNYFENYNKIKNLLSDYEKIIFLNNDCHSLGYLEHFHELFEYFKERKNKQYVLKIFKQIETSWGNLIERFGLFCYYGNFDIFYCFCELIKKNLKKTKITRKLLLGKLFIMMLHCDDIRLFEYFKQFVEPNELIFFDKNFICNFMLKCIKNDISKIDERFIVYKNCVISACEEKYINTFKYFITKYFEKNGVLTLNIMKSIISNSNINIYKYFIENYKEIYYKMINNPFQLRNIIHDILLFDNLKILKIMYEDDRISKYLLDAFVISELFQLQITCFRIQKFIMERIHYDIPIKKITHNTYIHTSLLIFTLWEKYINLLLEEPQKFFIEKKDCYQTHMTFNEILTLHIEMEKKYKSIEISRKLCMLIGVEYGLDVNKPIETQLFGIPNVSNLFETLQYL
jgi:hypothetical protein